MKNKEFQRRLAYDALVLLGVFTVILFMCRIWPLILLCILGLFAAMIRLLFLSRKEVVVIQPVHQVPAKVETERDLQELAFELAVRRITERITGDFPQARWVWKSQHPKEDILSGRDTNILLNRAGGFREAVVHIRNMQVTDITYCTALQSESETPATPPAEPAAEADSQTEDIEPKSAPVNYELLAFEWVDAHVLELNARCNECIANSIPELVISAKELPVQPSWKNICQELKRNGISACEPIAEGIKVYIKQKTCRKE